MLTHELLRKLQIHAQHGSLSLFPQVKKTSHCRWCDAVRLVASWKLKALRGGACGRCSIVEVSDNARHTSILHVATVGFAPARKLTLVDGVFGPNARHVIHPDQSTTCTQRRKGFICSVHNVYLVKACRRLQVDAGEVTRRAGLFWHTTSRWKVLQRIHHEWM